MRYQISATLRNLTRDQLASIDSFVMDFVAEEARRKLEPHEALLIHVSPEPEDPIQVDLAISRDTSAQIVVSTYHERARVLGEACICRSCKSN